MRVGECIRLYRNKAGFSLEKLARASHHDISYLSLVERGLVYPKNSNRFYDKLKDIIGIKGEHIETMKMQTFFEREQKTFSFSKEDYEFLPVICKMLREKKLTKEQYIKLYLSLLKDGK